MCSDRQFQAEMKLLWDLPGQGERESVSSVLPSCLLLGGEFRQGLALGPGSLQTQDFLASAP
jgi:hypothetical protein